MFFAIAHAFKLNDGTYAVRSPEFPGCEARDVAAERAREQFGDILREHVLQMLESGATPRLFTYDELGASLPQRCGIQLPAPDRATDSFDTVMPVRVKLPPEAAARLAASSPHPEPLDSAPTPPSAVEEPDSSTAAGSTPASKELGTLQPSARLAAIGARFARRDRHPD